MIALGTYQSQIPPGCWNTTGFRDCANLTWQLAQQVCVNEGHPGDDCAGPLYDANVMATCPCDPPRAPPPDAAAAAAKTAEFSMPTWGWLVLGGAAVYLLTRKKS